MGFKFNYDQFDVQDENRCIEKSAANYYCDLFHIHLVDCCLFIGDEVNGAKGWIRIGSFSMQPAEYLKIMVVWYLSYILSKRQDTIQENFVTDMKRPLMLVFAMIF